MASSHLTKKALAQAMKDLMAEKPMEKINVGEITRTCRISRKTFYYHFQDKYELVNWIYYTEFFAEIQNRELDRWDFLEAVCRYFDRNRAFYRNALQVQTQNCFSEYFTDLLGAVVKEHLQDTLEHNEHKEFFTSFFAEVVCLMVTRWLLLDAPIPPQEFIQALKGTITGIARNILQETPVGDNG